ncbi:MAG: urease accessory protein UreE [Burkholderiaceae bacterium]
MLRAEQRLAANDAQAVRDLALPQLALQFNERSKSRLRAQLSTGDEIGLFLPRGTVLRGGDVLACDNGQLVRVVAAPEDVMLIGAASAHKLTRLAYHLGNRHMQIEIGADYLKLEYDSVLADMVRGLGGTVMRTQAAFEPEGGAYLQGLAHRHHRD